MSLRKWALVFVALTIVGCEARNNGAPETETIMATVHTPATVAATATVEKVAELAWIEDGVDSREREAAAELYQLARFKPQLAEAVLSRKWVEDGIDPEEMVVVRSVEIIAQGGQGFEGERDEDRALAEAIKVLEMPFLGSVDLVDAGAAKALADVSLSDQERFQRVMEHPRVASDGLNDEDAVWAWMLGVAYLWDVREPGADRFDAVLAGEFAIAEKAVALPLSGDVIVMVVAVGEGVPWVPLQLAQMEDQARNVEALMQRPYPFDRLVLVLSEAWGGRPGAYVEISPEVPDFVLLAEVARYYWSERNGHPPWMAAGGVETVADLAGGHDPLGSSRGCGYPGKPEEVQPTILMIEKDAAGGSIRAQTCASTIGEGMFDDLYEVWGNREFLSRFRALYDITKSSVGHSKVFGMCDFVGVWTANASVAKQQAIEQAVIKWYGGRLECGP